MQAEDLMKLEIKGAFAQGYKLYAWDADAEEYMPVTGYVVSADGQRVELQTDSDEANPEDAPATPQPDWDIIVELGILLHRHEENSCCTDHACGCPGSQIQNLFEKLQKEYRTNRAAEPAAQPAGKTAPKEK